MAKIRIIINVAKKDYKKGSRYPVLLRISDRGKREYFSTGFTGCPYDKDINPDGDFVEGKEDGRFREGQGIKKFTVVRKEDDGMVEYSNRDANREIDKMVERIKEITEGYQKQGKDWTMEMLRNDFKKRPGRTMFQEYTEKDVIADKYIKKGRFKRAEITSEMVKSLERYDKNLKKKAIQDINQDYLEGYIKFCRDAGNKDNTIKMYLTEIRCILNLAKAAGVGCEESYPFSKNGRNDNRIKIDTIKNRTQKRFVSMDSLRKIAHTELRAEVEVARHLFLFSFHTRGINWKDMSQLTSDNIKYATLTDGTTVRVIRYKRSKTKGDFDIQITLNIQRELDWFKDNCGLFKNYLLPIVKKDVKPEDYDAYIKGRRRRFNEALKKMATELELPESQKELSSYWARHSFAMAMLRKGESIDHISQAMGHQSQETTKIYLESFSTEEMAKATNIDL